MSMEREASIRSLALKVLWENWGRPYTWGGDDPSGFDCSGLVIEVLKSVGMFPRKQDATADALLGMYETFVIGEESTIAGDLVFFLDGDRAVHVETIVADDGEVLYSMGASGGGASCRTVEIAWLRNAYVKVRPVPSIHPAMRRVYVNPYAEV